MRSKQCCILTWSSPGFCISQQAWMNVKVCPKKPRSQQFSGFSSEMGVANSVVMGDTDTQPTQCIPSPQHRYACRFSPVTEFLSTSWALSTRKHQPPDHTFSLNSWSSLLPWSRSIRATWLSRPAGSTRVWLVSEVCGSTWVLEFPFSSCPSPLSSLQVPSSQSRSQSHVQSVEEWHLLEKLWQHHNSDRAPWQQQMCVGGHVVWWLYSSWACWTSQFSHCFSSSPPTAVLPSSQCMWVPHLSRSHQYLYRGVPLSQIVCTCVYCDSLRVLEPPAAVGGSMFSIGRSSSFNPATSCTYQINITTITCYMYSLVLSLTTLRSQKLSSELLLSLSSSPDNLSDNHH